MRKILYLMFVFLLLFTGCIAKTEEITNKGSLYEYSKNIQNSAPMIIRLTLNELAEIKNAFDSMSPDEFIEYIQSEKSRQHSGGFWDYENSKNLLEELLSTSIVLLDENSESIKGISFYWERNEIQQVVFFEEEKSVSAIIYTANCTSPKELQLGDEAEITASKTVEKDSWFARLYDVKNADYKFFAEIFAEDTYIILRANNIESFDEFEGVFSRLSFVRMSDLIKESSVVSTETDAVLNIK